MKRKGLGLGKGQGYKNLLPKDGFIHGLSAKGVKTNYSGAVLPKTESIIPKVRLDAKGYKTGQLEWDSDDEFKVIDPETDEVIDTWYAQDLVDEYIRENKLGKHSVYGEWQDGEYLLFDKNGIEVDRIYAEELIKEMIIKQRKVLKYELDAKGFGRKLSKERYMYYLEVLPPLTLGKNETLRFLKELDNNPEMIKKLKDADEVYMQGEGWDKHDIYMKKGDQHYRVGKTKNVWNTEMFRYNDWGRMSDKELSRYNMRTVKRVRK
jgi:hypothetical protein